MEVARLQVTGPWSANRRLIEPSGWSLDIYTVHVHPMYMYLYAVYCPVACVSIRLNGDTMCLCWTKVSERISAYK